MPKGDIRFTPKNKDLRQLMQILRIKNKMKCPADYIENVLIDDIKKNKDVFPNISKKRAEKLKKIGPFIESPLHDKTTQF